MSVDLERKAVQRDMAVFKKKMGRVAAEREPEMYLDTGSETLHSVLGCADHGLPYGKMYEIAGEESHGKTALTLGLAAKAQESGAHIIWYSAEPWCGADWAAKRGLDASRIYLIEQEVVEKKIKGKTVKVQLSAEEKFQELEWFIRRVSARYPGAPIFVALDSTAALMTEEEIAADFDYNMRTNAALATFLSRALKRINSLCINHNVLFVLINQIRTKPGVAFGDPRYTPGGSAIRFYCSNRCFISRAAGGVIKGKGGRNAGFKGYITNIKNKLGGGSIEKAKIGFKIYFDGKRKDRYFDQSDLKRSTKEE